MRLVFYIIRWMAATPIFLALVVSLLAGSIVLIVVPRLDDGRAIKQWLREGGVYEEAVPIAVREFYQNTQQSIGSEGGEAAPELVPFQEFFTEENLVAQAKRALPSDWLAVQVEIVIDAIYAYLRGEKDSVVFTIDLAPIHENSRAIIADLFKQKISSLPPCAVSVRGEIESFDLMRATCRPHTISVQAIHERVDQEVQKLPLPENALLSETDLKDLDTGALEPFRRAFSVRAYLLVALGVLPFLLSALLFFLIPQRRGKYIMLGSAWVFSGIALVWAGVFARAQLADLIRPQALQRIPIDRQDMFSLVERVVQLAVNDLTEYLIVIGGAILLVGLIFFIIAKLPPIRLHKDEEDDKSL